MHVATKKLLQNNFATEDLEALEPLMRFYFTGDSSGLTNIYYAKVVLVRRTNMYQKMRRFAKLLKAGVDYFYTLSEDNKPMIRYTYEAFIRCVAESYQPATSTENRRRILMILKLHNIMSAVLRAHKKHYEETLEQSRKTLMRLKQMIVSLETENKKLTRLLNKYETEVDELRAKQRTTCTNARSFLGRQLRDLLQPMGYTIDDDRQKDIQIWFSRMSMRNQGVAHYDVQMLNTKRRRHYFLVYHDMVEDLRGDIEKTAAKLPLKLCCVENKKDEEKAGCVHSEKRS